MIQTSITSLLSDEAIHQILNIISSEIDDIDDRLEEYELKVLEGVREVYSELNKGKKVSAQYMENFIPKRDIVGDLREDYLDTRQYFLHTFNDVYVKATNNTDIGAIVQLNLPDNKDIGAILAFNRKSSDIFAKCLNEADMRIQHIKRDITTIRHKYFIRKVLLRQDSTLSAVTIKKEDFLDYQKLYQEGTLARDSITQGKENGFKTPFKYKRILGPGVVDVLKGNRGALFDDFGDTNPELKSEDYVIYFVTFGDLVDSALSVFAEVQRNKKDKTSIILGSAEMDQYPFEDAGISLADLPISVDAFHFWYLTEVMEKDKPSMTVMDFINSAITALVLPALDAVREGGRPPYVIRRYNISFPRKDQPFVPGERYDPVAIKKQLKTHTESDSERSHYSYLYFLDLFFF